MNKLSQMYVANMTLGGSDGGYPEDDVLNMLSKHGEIVRIEDEPWDCAHLEEDPEIRKYCITRKYLFEDGVVASLDALRAMGYPPRFEPLEEAPLVLDATEITKAA